MSENVAQKLIASHLADGPMHAGQPIGLHIDQTLTQDATGTLVMLELEAMELERVRTEISVQYVDHNLVQADHKNPDDHLFLLSACQRFGLWYSPAGNGVSHPVHQERFGKPGKTLLGSDSHTPAAGALGMLAIGAGGLEVALAMAGEPFYVRMPKIRGVELVGELPDWVSAKDVILEMLRRHGVDGGVGCIFEYYGPGLASLSAMDRHVIANMGTELGATSTVFPADEEVRRFLESHGRGEDFRELAADPDAAYDVHDRIDLSELEPLIAMPSSPGNVRPVREVAGQPVYQCYIGSSANPGYRDFAIAAEIVRDKPVKAGVSFDINPTSRTMLESLVSDGHLLNLLRAGGRIHQAGCNGCIGMGQAPATEQISLRTVPRNFAGRSGTREDKVCLVSPETAAASALTGVITDPRTLDRPYPRINQAGKAADHSSSLFVEPLPPAEAKKVEIQKGPNIRSLPDYEPVADNLEMEVALKVGDDLSTDEIMPAGSRVLPYRSNIPAISAFCFDIVDSTYAERAAAIRDAGRPDHAVIGGVNYGQGSSREHAALAPRYLGLQAVLAKSFARIHWENLINFGVLPLTFENPEDYDRIESSDTLACENLHSQLRAGAQVEVVNRTRNDAPLFMRHDLSARQVDVLIAGDLMRWLKQRLTTSAGTAS